MLYALCLGQLKKLEAEVTNRVKQPIYQEEVEAYNKIAEAIFEMLAAGAVRQKVQRRNMKEATKGSPEDRN